MSDGLPTEDQLRRIARGVQRRIDLRRRVARRAAGAAAAVALLGGGFALVVPFLGTAGASGGSTAGSAASPALVVRCHATSARSSATTAAKTPAGVDAQAVAAACGAAVEFQSGAGRVPSSAASGVPGTSPSPSPSPSGQAVVCRAPDGVLHVFPADARPATLCARAGMRPY